MTSSTFTRALEQMADECAVWLEGDYARALTNLSGKPESPIEEAMLLGLVHLSHALPGISFGEQAPLAAFARNGDKFAKIECQRSIGPYRVDFAIDVLRAGGVVGTIILECDGHNFHERTKEQAARDRARDRKLTNDGFVVLRFTGSEIYRTLGQVIADVMNAICNLWAPTK